VDRRSARLRTSTGRIRGFLGDPRRLPAEGRPRRASTGGRRRDRSRAGVAARRVRFRVPGSARLGSARSRPARSRRLWRRTGDVPPTRPGPVEGADGRHRATATARRWGCDAVDVYATSNKAGVAGLPSGGTS
jgi:hypothetical protein